MNYPTSPRDMQNIAINRDPYRDSCAGISTGIGDKTTTASGLLNTVAGVSIRMDSLLGELFAMATDLEQRLLPVRAHDPEGKREPEPSPHSVFDYANLLHRQCDRLCELRDHLGRVIGQL